MWHKYPEEIPPDIPPNENFGIDYEIRYRLPDGKIETCVTEWLWEREWNCIFPVTQWREYNPIIGFVKR